MPLSESLRVRNCEGLSLVRPTLDSELIGVIDDTISRYGLLDPTESVAVAVSGGKDSLLLALALKELDFTTTNFVVDMGYEVGWAQRIKRLLESVGLEAVYIDVHASRPATSESAVMSRRSLKILTSEPVPANKTPCTLCYNSKAFALQETMSRAGLKKVAFGHHLTDACTSLLKEALYAVDRWTANHERYERSNFLRLVEQLAAEAVILDQSGELGPLLIEIRRLVDDRQIDTDEPPRQDLVDGSSSDLQIVRPLFGVSERTISEHVLGIGAVPEGSGCGHGSTFATRTPRELVQHALFSDTRFPTFDMLVTRWVCQGIDNHGRVSINARRQRAARLGENYKPGLGGFNKV